MRLRENLEGEGILSQQFMQYFCRMMIRNGYTKVFHLKSGPYSQACTGLPLAAPFNSCFQSDIFPEGFPLILKKLVKLRICCLVGYKAWTAASKFVFQC